MRITVEHHHYFHGGNEDEVKKLLNFIINKLNKMGQELENIKQQNTALIAAVAEEDTVIDSAVVLIEGFGTTLTNIKQQLADAIAANDPAALQAVADSLGSTITDVNARKQALADAVAANTPAA